jgi:hypothetical protein
VNKAGEDMIPHRDPTRPKVGEPARGFVLPQAERPTPVIQSSIEKPRIGRPPGSKNKTTRKKTSRKRARARSAS